MSGLPAPRGLPRALVGRRTYSVCWYVVMVKSYDDPGLSFSISWPSPRWRQAGRPPPPLKFRFMGWRSIALRIPKPWAPGYHGLHHSWTAGPTEPCSALPQTFGRPRLQQVYALLFWPAPARQLCTARPGPQLWATKPSRGIENQVNQTWGALL